MNATTTSYPFGNAPLNLHFCPKCVTGEMSQGVAVEPMATEINNQRSWCSKVYCPSCLFEWYVCRECSKSRQRLDSRKKLAQHTYAYHRTTLPVLAIARCAGGNNIDSQKSNSKQNASTTAVLFPSESTNNRDRSVTTPIALSRAIDEHDLTPSREYGGVPSAVSNCNFWREESKEYFANNYHQQNGFSYLVSEAFYSGYKTPGDIANNDLDMFMSFFMLVKKLTIEQSDVLGDFLDMLFRRFEDMEKCYIEQQRKLENRDHYCRKCSCSKCHRLRCLTTLAEEDMEMDRILLPAIPRSALDIRNKIREGRRSLFNLLPHPLIRKMDDPSDEHVYVLPSDCILHFLAQGIMPLDFNHRVVSYPILKLNQTPRGVAIAKVLGKVKTGRSTRQRHFNISFLEWKDDCESAKSNRLSKFPLWIFTITIFREGDSRDSPECTYCVAIGPKGKSHESVESVIKEDLIRMRTTAKAAMFGWNGTNRPFPCTFSADMYMSLGDQPERRGGNILQLGNSRNHARWRYGCDYSQLLDVIPACPKCYEEMLKCDSFFPGTILLSITGLGPNWTAKFAVIGC
jgi:hypothetical protein